VEEDRGSEKKTKIWQVKSIQVLLCLILKLNFDTLSFRVCLKIEKNDYGANDGDDMSILDIQQISIRLFTKNKQYCR
jgi:hypothetical protein